MGLPLQTMTLDAFLAWENEQPERHEYWRGEVFAKTGGRRSHGCVVANLMRHVGNVLASTPCRPFSESMKVQVAHDTVLYPDVFVTCDGDDLRTDMIFKAPLVIIEVLSPSTQGFDRGLKFAMYRRLTSLREYVLIDPDSRRVESFRLGAEGLWVLHDMSDGAPLYVPSLDCTIAAADLFDGIAPDTPT